MEAAPRRSDAEAGRLLADELERLAARASALDEEGVHAVAAWTLMHAFEYEAAELGWRRVIELQQRSVEAVFQRGYCLLELGRYDDAAAAFRESIELDDSLRAGESADWLDWIDDDPAYRLGNCHHAQGDLDAAVAAYELSARRNTVGVDALREVVRCQLAAGRPEQALEALGRLEERANRFSVRAEVEALRADARRQLVDRRQA